MKNIMDLTPSPFLRNKQTLVFDFNNVVASDQGESDDEELSEVLIGKRRDKIEFCVHSLCEWFISAQLRVKI